MYLESLKSLLSIENFKVTDSTGKTVNAVASYTITKEVREEMLGELGEIKYATSAYEYLEEASSKSRAHLHYATVVAIEHSQESIQKFSHLVDAADEMGFNSIPSNLFVEVLNELMFLNAILQRHYNNAMLTGLCQVDNLDMTREQIFEMAVKNLEEGKTELSLNDCEDLLRDTLKK